MVKRPERATDAQRHHLEIRPGGVVQPEDLQRFLECLGGVARVYGQERFFAERTLRKAGIDSYELAKLTRLTSNNLAASRILKNPIMLTR